MHEIFVKIYVYSSEEMKLKLDTLLFSFLLICSLVSQLITSTLTVVT